MRLNWLHQCCLLLLFLNKHVECQRKISPCPTVFSYDLHEDTNDVWYGTVRLQSSVKLYGVTIDVIFDRTSLSFGSQQFNEASTSNFMEYRLENKNFRLDPGRVLVMNIYVKYRDYVPLLKQIRLNGQNVCVDLPAVAAQPIYNGNSPNENEYETPKKTTRRENPSNFDIYDTTTQRNNNFYSTTTQRSSQNGNNNDYYGDRDRTTERTYSNNNQGRTTQRPTNNNNNQGSFNSQANNQENINKNTNSQTYTQRPSGNSNSFNRDTNIAFVGDTLTGSHDNNNYNPPTLRPYDQRISTTQNYNARDTTTRRSSITTTKSTHFQGDFHGFSSGSTTESILNSDENSQCGTVIPKTNPLIVHGLETYPGNYPWHTAIYISQVGNLKYICGGSLISMSAVLTAAHCVTHSKSKFAINKDNLLLYLGKHNLQKWTGQEQDGKVIDIIVNPEYDPERFYSDLAILKTKDSFTRTNYVRTVCLWKFDSDLKVIVDKLGSVPGWGYNENGLVSEDLSYIKMPVVTHETCIWSNRDFFSKITSEKSFCAGFRNSSVCNGDSGGGMVFKQANKWYLRGVVSVSIALQNSLKCDPNHYAVFVDVAKYSSWISENLQQ